MALSTHCPFCLSSFSVISPSSSCSATSFLNYLPLSRSRRKLQSLSAGGGSSFELSLSCSTVGSEVENPERILKKKKKKRKPRPDFYEQTRERWSAKIGSQRTKLPWQQSKVDEESPEIAQPSLPIGVSDAGEERDVERSDFDGFTFRSAVVSAPWHHGSGNDRSHEDSDAQISVLLDEATKDVEVVSEEDESSVGRIVEKMMSLEIKEEPESDSDDDMGSDVRVSSAELEVKLSNDCEEVSGTVTTGNAIHLPWEREEGSEEESRSNTALAEVTIPEPELQRLRNVALSMKERMNVGSAGVTQAVVNEISEKWREAEVVKLKFEGAPAVNMKLSHEILERKTAGLVIWRSGSLVVLYRGMTYKLPCVQQFIELHKMDQEPAPKPKTCSKDITTKASKPGSLPLLESLGGDLTDLSEIDSVLNELGPRFKDWSGYDPVPVDADLLPSVVPGYEPPFRLLPHRAKPGLHDNQMTYLRRFARKMPPHFALGRSRQHQGLAATMVKLWEKSSIAKIAIKRGVPNTNNERMAEELKRLTGGTLVSRNKEYIVFYRGNDFLSPAMKGTLIERRQLTRLNQDEEEEARGRALALITSTGKTLKGPFIAGTLAETVEAKSRWGTNMGNQEREKLMREEFLSRQASSIRHLKKKLVQAQLKVKKAEKVLHKVHDSLEPAELPTDLETISDEERHLFRKIGLSMKPFLLLGTRGVFDGTVENMHLHWKYRELVKIVVKGKRFLQVKHIAISLEAESGGILISVDKTSKGYVIIMYRGKNYSRPSVLRPKNLLTRRQALARSTELQRREALNHHILDLREKINMMESQLDQMETATEISDEILQSQFIGASSSDEDLEVESEE